MDWYSGSTLGLQQALHRSCLWELRRRPPVAQTRSPGIFTSSCSDVTAQGQLEVTTAKCQQGRPAVVCALCPWAPAKACGLSTQRPWAKGVLSTGWFGLGFVRFLFFVLLPRKTFECGLIFLANFFWVYSFFCSYLIGWSFFITLSLFPLHSHNYLFCSDTLSLFVSSVPWSPLEHFCTGEQIRFSQ